MERHKTFFSNMCYCFFFFWKKAAMTKHLTCGVKGLKFGFNFRDLVSPAFKSQYDWSKIHATKYEILYYIAKWNENSMWFRVMYKIDTCHTMMKYVCDLGSIDAKEHVLWASLCPDYAAQWGMSREKTARARRPQRARNRQYLKEGGHVSEL